MIRRTRARTHTHTLQVKLVKSYCMLCNVSILAFLFLTWDLPCTIFYCFLISLVIKVSMINERSYTAKLLDIYHIISVRLELLLFSYETSRALSEHFLNLLSGMLCG